MLLVVAVELSEPVLLQMNDDDGDEKEIQDLFFYLTLFSSCAACESSAGEHAVRGAVMDRRGRR